MAHLSGYDSEAVGFDSVTHVQRSESNISTQTNEFNAVGTASQTTMSRECGCMTTSKELDARKEYSLPDLNIFLRKVVPGVLEQLNHNNGEFLFNSSDSDEDDVIQAKLLQEWRVQSDAPILGAGDQTFAVLGVSWSSAGNTLAVSIGKTQHEDWCDHDGIIRIYTLKRNPDDKFIHTMDITEKNCVSIVKFHPAVAALLAYGTVFGDIVLCNLSLDGMHLAAPSDCHGSKRISGLYWADPSLANAFLMQHITNTGKRRNASDQVLISSGSDGSINVWQVNAGLQLFENVLRYSLNGNHTMSVPDITCFDFIKTMPLRPTDEKIPGDIFVVGAVTGKLYLCKTKHCQQIIDTTMMDPVYEILDGHSTCVLDVAFSYQRPGIFASVSMDSELRIYDISQFSPIKVLCLNVPISCMSWLPNNHCVIVLGLSKIEKDVIKIYNVSSGRPIPIEGLTGFGAAVTALSVNQSGSCRIVAGDGESNVRVWELPSRRIRMSPEDLEF